MHKLNTIKLQVWLSLILSMQYVSLHSMLSIKNEDDQKVLWDIVLINGLSRDDYDAHRTCALVDKRSHQTIEDTYRQHKKRIEDVMQRKSISVTGHTSWNKDFSKCAWVTFSDEVVPGGKNLQLTLVGVTDENRVISSSQLWQEFHFPIFENNVRPFFNEDGRVCFYGYGKTACVYKHEISLMEYLIALDGKAECYDCQFVTVAPEKEGHGNSSYSGVCFLNFPILLKAWLQSKIARNMKISDVGTLKTYNINGVTFPKDCKMYQKHVAWEKMRKIDKNPTHRSHDHLSKDFEQYLDKKYAWQQHEKRNGDEKK